MFDWMKLLATMSCLTWWRKHKNRLRSFLIDSGTLAFHLIFFQIQSIWSTWSSCSTETTRSKAESFPTSTTTLSSTDDQYSSSTVNSSTSTKSSRISTSSNAAIWENMLPKHVVCNETLTAHSKELLRLALATITGRLISETLSRKLTLRERLDLPSRKSISLKKILTE